MRLDRFLSDMGAASRSQSQKAARAGLILVNGVPVRRADVPVDPEKDEIVLSGERIFYEKNVYLMLNKPAGVISATDDPKKKTVLDLLPPRLRARGLFPCGRLDIDTTGLLILTDDGALAHALLSPRHHAEKTYRFRTDVRLPDTAERDAADGLLLADGYRCLPAVLLLDAEGNGGSITLTEGKFHQIKRMTEALGAHTVALERVSFAGIPLDPMLSPGMWRRLTAEECRLLEAYRV